MKARGGVTLLCLVVLLAGCARPPVRAAIRPPAPERAADAAFRAEVAAAAAELAREVPRASVPAPAAAAQWIAAARRGLAAAGVGVTRSQLIVVVDRNPRVQRLCIVAARPAGAWDVVGCDAVSTGQAGRRGQVAAALSHACRLFVCCRQYETGSRASEDQCQALSRTVQVCGRRVSCTG